jgi:hypothetical protein
MLTFILVLSLLSLSAAMTGFDISKQMCEGSFSGSSVWNCFAKNGDGFGVIQAIQGGNGMTTTVSSCVSAGKSQGFALSLYGWFCPYCRNQANAYQTAYNTIINLKNQGIYPGSNYTYFYIDVEDATRMMIVFPKILR